MTYSNDEKVCHQEIRSVWVRGVCGDGQIGRDLATQMIAIWIHNECTMTCSVRILLDNRKPSDV